MLPEYSYDARATEKVLGYVNVCFCVQHVYTGAEIKERCYVYLNLTKLDVNCLVHNCVFKTYRVVAMHASFDRSGVIDQTIFLKKK